LAALRAEGARQSTQLQRSHTFCACHHPKNRNGVELKTLTRRTMSLFAPRLRPATGLLCLLAFTMVYGGVGAPGAPQQRASLALSQPDTRDFEPDLHDARRTLADLTVAAGGVRAAPQLERSTLARRAKRKGGGGGSGGSATAGGALLVGGSGRNGSSGPAGANSTRASAAARYELPLWGSLLLLLAIMFCARLTLPLTSKVARQQRQLASLRVTKREHAREGARRIQGVARANPLRDRAQEHVAVLTWPNPPRQQHETRRQKERRLRLRREAEMTPAEREQYAKERASLKPRQPLAAMRREQGNRPRALGRTPSGLKRGGGVQAELDRRAEALLDDDGIGDVLILPQAIVESQRAVEAEFRAGMEEADDEAQDWMVCPITLNVMRCAVVTLCHHHFEQSDLLVWIDEKGTCPLCRCPLSWKDCKRDTAMQQEILKAQIANAKGVEP